MSSKLTSHINIYGIYTRSVHFDNDFVRIVYDGHPHVLSKSKHFILPVFVYHPRGHDSAPRRGSTDLSNGKLLYNLASPEANRGPCLSPKHTSLQKFHRKHVVEWRALIKMHGDGISLSPLKQAKRTVRAQHGGFRNEVSPNGANEGRRIWN